MEIQTISPESLNQHLSTKSECILIDVRTPAEYEASHIVSAVNYPLGSPELKTQIKYLKDNPKEVFITCQGGTRAKTACKEFIDEGLSPRSLEGGTAAWIAAGLPAVYGEKNISLERQVRIAAGSLVLVGVVLSYLINPQFILLSGFVGAGLVFAGITDTCGMGMLLAKMPWNGPSCNSSCCSK